MMLFNMMNNRHYVLGKQFLRGYAETELTVCAGQWNGIPTTFCCYGLDRSNADRNGPSIHYMKGWINVTGRELFVLGSF